MNNVITASQQLAALSVPRQEILPPARPTASYRDVYGRYPTPAAARPDMTPMTPQPPAPRGETLLSAVARRAWRAATWPVRFAKKHPLVTAAVLFLYRKPILRALGLGGEKTAADAAT